MADVERILILGGTKEAAELAGALSDAGRDVTTSLAGRTKEPKPLSGAVRIGGFGGVEGLAKWLSDNKITRLIDATHPFARQMSRNAEEAAKIANVAFEVHQRPPWTRIPGDHWIEVDDISAAVKALPEGARVLLALGRQYIAPFAARENVFFLIRMVDPPDAPLPFAEHELLLSRPHEDAEDEKALLQDKGITHIVCRNSGGEGAYAKIAAARALGLPVIMIDHPDQREHSR